MERLIFKDLLKWKNSAHRKPLLLQGVRQSGKTWVLKEFGSREFSNVAYLNFETKEIYSSIFDRDLDPKRILREISAVLDIPIGTDTLVIFDEVQYCGRALTSLKYFCEEVPEYPVVAAGSLLGVALSGRGPKGGQRISFPVGKVDMLRMYPMSFKEFLLAEGKTHLVPYVEGADPFEPISDAVLSILEQAYKEYLCVGGMPEAVSSWVTEGDMSSVERIQTALLNSYSNDFGKYAPPNVVSKLFAVWDAIPMQMAKEARRFVFGQAVPGARAADLDDAVQWLKDAGLVYRVESVSVAGIPLSAFAEPSKYKLYYCDVGLLRVKSGISASAVLLETDGLGPFNGALTENYVLCELIASGFQKEWYWSSSGKAEVDFVLQYGISVVPIEVKSGSNIRAKSLQMFIDKYDPDVAVLVSHKNRGRNGNVVRIPLPLVWTLGAVLDRISVDSGK